jgi:hypothetical protein
MRMKTQAREHTAEEAACGWYQINVMLFVFCYYFFFLLNRMKIEERKS